MHDLQQRRTDVVLAPTNHVDALPHSGLEEGRANLPCGAKPPREVDYIGGLHAIRVVLLLQGAQLRG